MIFDRMATLVERYLPQYVPLMRRAALFVFPGHAHEILKRDLVDSEETAFLEENFFLPFPVVAVEDTASCVLLVDPAPHTVGLKTPRFFLECCPVDAPEVAFPDDGKPDASLLARRALYKEHPDACGLIVGTLDGLEYRDGHRYFPGRIVRALIACRERVLTETDESETDPVLSEYLHTGHMLRGAATCAEEIMWFNSPNRFVFESTPLRIPQNHQRSGRIQRSHERPQYTLVTPHEARVKLGLSEPTGRHPAPHARRKHYRTLSSERFVHKQGQVITIPATWVGPSEAVRGNKRYRVLLEL